MYYRTIYVYHDILIYIPISDPRFHIKYGNLLIAASLESFPVQKKMSKREHPQLQPNAHSLNSALHSPNFPVISCWLVVYLPL